MKKVLWISLPIVLVALLFGVASVRAFEGGHHHMGPGPMGSMEDMMLFHLTSMAKDLNLTQAQQAKLDSMKQQAETNMQQGMEKHKQLHDAIQQQLNNGTFDFAQLRSQLDAQIDDRATTAHAMVAQFQEFFDQLTPDQKKSLSDAMKKQMQDMQERMQMWQQHSHGDQQQNQQQH